MFEYAVREHPLKGAITERQIAAISHQVVGEDTKLAGDSLGRKHALQRRIDTERPISGASRRDAPPAPTATDLQE